MNFGSLRYRWDSLTRNQQIGVAVVGVLVLYGLLTVVGTGIFSLPHLLAVATIVFVAFPVHEFAHAAAAVALGDETPRRMGRYTLNPLVHIDWLGAVLILIAGIGWAKPVLWNPRNITIDRRLGSIIVAVVGPLSNLLLAGVAAIVFRLVSSGMIQDYLLDFIQINVYLFVFNMIPIPPLDGSHILFALLPGNNFQLQAQLSRYGFLILMVVIFFVPQLVVVPSNAIINLLL